MASDRNYLKAAEDCYSDGAHLWAINSEEELDWIKADFYPSEDEIWIGLQDWAFRSAGSNNADWAFSAQPTDMNDEWMWPDGSTTIIRESAFVAVTGGQADPVASWLVFDQNRNNHYYAHTLSSKRIRMRKDFQNHDKHYLCEYSLACNVCPTGYEKFNLHCFKKVTTPATYNDASNNCAADGSHLWTPRTEELALYAKFSTDVYFGSATTFWIGLAHNENGGRY